MRVYEAIIEAGKKFGIVNGGYRALDSLSAEKGYKHWHQDLRHDDTPLEAGLGFTCKLKSDTFSSLFTSLDRQLCKMNRQIELIELLAGTYM